MWRQKKFRSFTQRPSGQLYDTYRNMAPLSQINPSNLPYLCINFDPPFKKMGPHLMSWQSKGIPEGHPSLNKAGDLFLGGVNVAFGGRQRPLGSLKNKSQLETATFQHSRRRASVPRGSGPRLGIDALLAKASKGRQVEDPSAG